MKKTGPFQEKQVEREKSKCTARRRPGGGAWHRNDDEREEEKGSVTVNSFRTLQDLRGMRQAQSKLTVIETKNKKRNNFDERTLC